MKKALFEKYRPACFAEVVGQPKAVAALQAIEAKYGGFGGLAFWITGPTGTGKTTLAEIVASTLADDWLIERFDSGNDVNADALERITRCMGMYGSGKGGRVWIINEAHALNSRAIESFLGILERIPDHVCFIFTTTKDGEQTLLDGSIDGRPITQRCLPIALTNQGFAKPAAAALQAIADKEGLAKGKPAEYFLRLVQGCNGSLRGAIQALLAAG